MSRINDAIDKLVSLWAAGLTDVTVYDGPLVTGAEPRKRLYVGFDGDGDVGDLAAASGTQTWAGLGAGKLDTAFAITCAAVVLDGAGDVKVARDDAAAVFEAAQTVVRDNVDLGFPAPTHAQVSTARLVYRHDPAVGIEARYVFDVEVSTRI